MSALNIIFAGTPDFAARHLHHICAHSAHKVCAVFSQPDRPQGRGKKLIATPVKVTAQHWAIPVFQPQTLKDADIQNIMRQLQADIMVVVAYGLLLPQTILDIPRLGCINVHASLLPRWRGAAPIERAIEAGDGNTGITLMQMDAGLDNGDMLLQATTPISAEDTGDSLRETLLQQGCALLLAGLDSLAHRTMPGAQPQQHALASYATKLNKAEAHINWHSNAVTIALKIRAFNSSNVCYSTLGGERIKIWRAHALEETANKRAGEIIHVTKEAIDVACSIGVLRLEQIQLSGGRALDVKDILNARSTTFIPGACFI